MSGIGGKADEKGSKADKQSTMSVIGRLAAIAVAEPETRSEIEQFTQALRSAPVVQ